MPSLATLLRRVRLLLRRRDAESEMDEEMRYHLDMEIAERVAAGASPEAARRAALVAFGGVERYREEGRDARGVRPLEDFLRDLRYAARGLRKAPSFAAVAVLTVALGIGATTAIFSAVEGVLLRPFPWTDSERLVVPRTFRRADAESWSVTHADFLDWRRHGVFAGVAIWQSFAVNLVGDDGEAERVPATQTTDGLFETLGVAPVLGRRFVAADFDAASPRVAMISHGLWQRRFGGARDVVGRTVRMSGRAVEVVGVVPRGLAYPTESDLWLPFRPRPEDASWLERTDNFLWQGIARLAPGKDLRATLAELDALAAAVAAAHPEARRNVTTVIAVPLVAGAVGGSLTRTLWVLLAAVACLLLIACVNTANLLLGRAAARRRELALRGALGAGRGRIVRQQLAESLLLGLAGGAVGVALAFAGTRAVVALAPAGMPRLDNIGVNLPVLGVAFALSLGAALLFGLLPALQSARVDPSIALGETNLRAAGGTWSRRFRAGLVVAELALSLVLLAGAALLGRSLERVLATDPGFEPEGLQSFEVSLQGDRYSDDDVRAAAYESILREVAAEPGVEATASISALPVGGGGYYLGRAFLAEGSAEPPAGTDLDAMWLVVSPGFFSTLRIPILRGRDFTSSDARTAPPVAIVSREFARRMFGDTDPIGRRVRSWRDENVYREIVGVVDDVRYQDAAESQRPLFFVPLRQDTWGLTAVVARTRQGALSERAVRDAVRRADAEIPVANLSTMEAALLDSVAPRRFSATLLAVFAGLALALATIGVYGVVAYGVAQRQRELGIRMALGARRHVVLLEVAREAARTAAVGVAFGLVAAAAATRSLGALLYGVTATDPRTFAAVAALLFAVAMMASLAPALRAARVSPVEVLRLD